MKVSYEEYEIMLDEVMEDIADGVLDADTTVLIQRDDTGRRQIIDWYYNDKEMGLLLEEDIFDGAEDIAEKRNMRELFEAARPSLEEVSVQDFIDELSSGAAIL